MMNWLSARFGLNKRMLFAVAAVMAVLCWFYFSLPVQVFFGDDSRFIYTALHGGMYSRFPDAIFQAELLKYRPVLNAVLSLFVPVFGANHAAWEAFDKVGTMATCFIFFLCAWAISKRNLITALAFMLLLGVSRFVYTAVTQVGGFIEWGTLALTLLILLEVILYFDNEESGSPARAVLWYGLLLYTNERFVPMIVPLLLFLWLAKRSNLLILASLAIVASNVLIKAVVFHFNFLQGTNGQAIQFKLSDLFGFIVSGIQNLLGYPVIPQYLSGMQFDQLTTIQQTPSYIFSIAIIASFIAAFALKRPQLPKTAKEWAVPSILIVALGLLVLSASVTVRQETRFLFAPYAIMLLLVAYGFGQIQAQRAVVTVLTAIVGISGFLIDTPFHDYVSNTWFMTSSHWLKQAQTLLIDRRAEHSKNVIIITHGVEWVQSFTLNPWFMSTFDPYADYTMAFVPDPPVSSGEGDAAFHADASYYDVDISGAHFRDASADARMHALLHGPKPRVDLVKKVCEQGPAGLPIVAEGWPSLYDSIPTITMPVGTQCSTGTIRVNAGERLSIFAAVPELSVEVQGSKIADAAFISAIIHEGAKQYRLIDHAQALPPVDNRIRWTYYEADMQPFAGKNISIELRAETPAGDEYLGSIAVGMPWIRR